MDSDVDTYSITPEEALLARALSEIDFPEDESTEGEGSSDDSASSDSGDATAADLSVTFVSGLRVYY